MATSLRALPLLLLLAVPVRAADPPLPKSFDPDAVGKYVAAKVKTKGHVGLSLAVVRDGTIVLAKGYGKASLPDGPAVTPETRFAVGSVTKQFACACILLLAEDGKLSVQDKVSKYYPDLTRAGDITLYDLMTHASGYPDYYPLDFVDRRLVKRIDPDDLLRQYACGKLDFEPGTRWSYSNTGYILLGRVVERVSGKPFAEFLGDRILKPAGMTGATFEPGAKDRATGYTAFALGDAEPAVPKAAGWLHAAGGLWATATDLAKWDVALVSGKVLKPESYRLMTTPRELANGRGTNYGCGLRAQERDGELMIGHSGAVSGFHAYTAVVPRTKSAVVLLSNAEHADTGSLHQQLLGLLLKDQDAAANVVPKIAGPSPEQAARELLRQMQAGEMKRDQLGEEFAVYLTDERVRAAAPRLKALGDPEKVEVDAVRERGGMEVAVITFRFKGGRTAKASLYRTPDGKVQQFLLSPG